LDLKESISLREGRGNTFITSQKKRRKGDCTERAGNSRKDLGTLEETIPEGQAGEGVSILSSL
jgi:hypothetical protein